MSSSVLPLLVSADVCCVETWDELDAPLFPDEAAYLADAGPRRRAEFITSRACARTALDRLGVAAAPLVPGSERRPTWPAGVVGSLTHCAGYRAAACASTTTTAALGIDAEPHRPLPNGVSEIVACDTEPALVARLAGEQPDIHWGTVLFSAKEAVYKALNPLTGRWLEFSDLRLHLDPAGSFIAHVRDGGCVTGRFAVARGLVATAVEIPARA